MEILLSSTVFFAFTACSDWLDVTSKTDIPSDTHFSSETGFKDAVIGLYVKLSQPQLYGKTLVWHVNEFVSQNYAVVAGAPDLNVPKYEYMVEPFVSYRNSIWLNAYEVIANMNNILRYEEKNRQVMNPIIDSLVRGETLALRAMVHFDLLRMFGKGNLEGRQELLDELSIPYSLDFKKNAPVQVTYRRFFELLEKDIEEASCYLQADPYNNYRLKNLVEKQEYYKTSVDNSFLHEDFERRRYRMNYYAVQALHARILMWKGDVDSKDKALAIAEELIDRGRYSWSQEASVVVKNQEWWKSDLQFHTEHLFTLSVEKLEEYQTHTSGTGNWFDAQTPNNTYLVVYLTLEKAKEIYEIPGVGESDWRYTECLLPQGSRLNNMGIVKLRQYSEHDEKYSKMLPLFRISEMYYIAAECCMEPGANYNKMKAVTWLNEVREHRGIARAQRLPETLNDEEVRNEIYKEYRKEFVGEGQMFFYYKRKGMEYIPGYNEMMDDGKYQYPMPDDEIELGGRV